MEHILGLFMRFFEHFTRNFTDYLLFFGVFLILTFVYMTFGVSFTILGLGLTFIILSVIITLNKKKGNRNNY